MNAARIAELRALRGQGMASAVGEYTPDELWEALDCIESLRASLRDYFAAKAMQAMITKSHGQDKIAGAKGVPLIAQYAYEFADAMMKARQS